MSKFIIVPPDRIEEVWPIVASGIARAIDSADGEATVEDTMMELKLGRSSLVLLESDKGAVCGMVILFCNFPQYRICRVLLAFGRNIAGDPDLEAEFEAWAAARGAKYIEAWVSTDSRARLFKRHGYQPAYQVIRKEIDHVRCG